MSEELNRFRGARLMLIRQHVFFGSIAMQLQLVEDENLPAAAGVDGRSLFFNPGMSSKFTFGEVVAVVAHEVLHVVLLHHLRRGKRDHRKWNCACDYAINPIVNEQLSKIAGGVKCQLPSGALISSEFFGMSAEEIYNKLPDGQSGDDGFDIVMDGAKGKSQSEIAAEEGRIKAAIQNAAQLARKAGQMSGSLERLIEAVCEPKASWRQVLMEYISEKASTDYNWAKPSQRMLSQFGIVYPTLDGEKLGNIVVLVDSSGSCYSDQDQFASEISDILSAYDCSVDVIYHDTKVQAVDHYESDDLPIVLRPKGFGGTDCKEAYAHAVELDPVLIIHATDLELDFSRILAPDCDVIIACSRKQYFKNCPSWARLIDIS